MQPATRNRPIRNRQSAPAPCYFRLIAAVDDVESRRCGRDGHVPARALHEPDITSAHREEAARWSPWNGSSSPSRRVSTPATRAPGPASRRVPWFVRLDTGRLHCPAPHSLSTYIKYLFLSLVLFLSIRLLARIRAVARRWRTLSSADDDLASRYPTRAAFPAGTQRPHRIRNRPREVMLAATLPGLHLQFHRFRTHLLRTS